MKHNEVSVLDYFVCFVTFFQFYYLARRLPLLLTNLQLVPWAVPGGTGVTGVVHEKRPDREMMKPCHIRVESGRSHETADADS